MDKSDVYRIQYTLNIVGGFISANRLGGGCQGLEEGAKL